MTRSLQRDPFDAVALQRGQSPTRRSPTNRSAYHYFVIITNMANVVHEGLPTAAAKVQIGRGVVLEKQLLSPVANSTMGTRMISHVVASSAGCAPNHHWSPAPSGVGRQNQSSHGGRWRRKEVPKTGPVVGHRRYPNFGTQVSTTRPYRGTRQSWPPFDGCGLLHHPMKHDLPAGWSTEAWPDPISNASRRERKMRCHGPEPADA